MGKEQKGSFCHTLRQTLTFQTEMSDFQDGTFVERRRGQIITGTAGGLTRHLAICTALRFPEMFVGKSVLLRISLGIVMPLSFCAMLRDCSVHRTASVSIKLSIVGFMWITEFGAGKPA